MCYLRLDLIRKRMVETPLYSTPYLELQKPTVNRVISMAKTKTRPASPLEQRSIKRLRETP
jgi:hypothetical protein